MSQTTMTVSRWVEVLEAAGIGEEGQQEWHRQFERLYPEGHQSFLEWLGLPAERIAEVRRQGR